VLERIVHFWRIGARATQTAFPNMDIYKNFFKQPLCIFAGFLQRPGISGRPGNVLEFLKL
jgi:hypothetical protein